MSESVSDEDRVTAAVLISLEYATGAQWRLWTYQGQRWVTAPVRELFESVGDKIMIPKSYLERIDETRPIEDLGEWE